MTQRKEITRELEAFELVKHKISWEGFDYCFRYYSDFEEVKDEKFHELRKGYLNGKVQSVELNHYVEKKIAELKKEATHE